MPRRGATVNEKGIGNDGSWCILRTAAAHKEDRLGCGVSELANKLDLRTFPNHGLWTLGEKRNTQDRLCP